MTISGIFHNLWGLRCPRELEAFFKEHQDIDFLCATEVTHISEGQLKKYGHSLVYDDGPLPYRVDGKAFLVRAFKDWRVFYTTADRSTWKCSQSGARFTWVGFGSAIVIRKEIKIVHYGQHRIRFNSDVAKDRMLQYVVFRKSGTDYLLAHLHGVWIRGNTKGDHTLRIQQSLEVRAMLRKLARQHKVEKIIFGGDLNLDITTQALALIVEGTSLDDQAFRNLIVEFGITGTRTPLYGKYNLKGHPQYADYVLTSQSVQVHSFTAYQEELNSNHAALRVEFT